MANLSLNIGVRIGLWADGLRLGIKEALKRIAPLKPEVIGLDALGAETSARNLTHTGRRDLAQYVRGRGMVLSAFRADVGGRRLADPKQLDQNLTRIREALELANAVGASQLVLAAGYVPAPDDKADAVARATLGEATKVLMTLASSSAARICWLAGSEAPEVLQQFLDQYDSAGVLQVDLNPGGFVMRGLDPLKAMESLSSRVALVRAADHYRGGAEASFGRGDVRFGELLIALSARSGKEPVDLLADCTLDVDRVQAISTALRRLQALRQNPLA